MRFLIKVCLLSLLACSPLSASTLGSVIEPAVSPNPVTAKGPGPVGGGWGLLTIPFSISPPGQDSKIAPLPTRMPAEAKRNAIPHLSEFFTQLDRYNEVKIKSGLIEGWVYTREIGPFTDDYEEALHRLEVSDACLDEAMYRLVSSDQFSLLPDPAIELAKSELEKAERIIDLLCEIAKLEI